MSRLADSAATFSSSRAPPPPVPAATSPPPPAACGPPHNTTTTATATATAKKKKHRGLIRAVGGFFKRKCSDGDDLLVRPPLASDASSNRMTQWIYGSHRQSMPEIPLEVSDPLLYQERETLTSVCPLMEEKPVNSHKRVKQDKKKAVDREDDPPNPSEPKATASFVQAKQSPTDVSELLDAIECSGVESNRDPLHVSFLIFGGSEVDSTFEPELRPSEFDNVHGSEIRPVLQNKMPLFFSLPLAERMRRSSAMSDPKEYDL
ncbi:unnamed protein product [Hyaloperonospora brassicae]|uniref:Uncharacterized protein n=1 Tax=Hyaloperonospora brassicae TaxID=162125 RepID=A0AAV0UEW3_HYABA|nr:unnamed protein product [Hyaloperonospora brassicae]